MEVLVRVPGNGGRRPYLLFNLEPINSRSELTENVIGPLVELELCRNQVGKIPQGLGGIKDLTSHQQSEQKKKKKEKRKGRG